MGNAPCLTFAGLWRLASVTLLLTGVSAQSLAQSAEGYEIRLVQPGSPAFDELLQKSPWTGPVPQIVKSAQQQGALLINDSTHPIVAFAIRWQVTHKMVQSRNPTGH
jgi:hypothetical protein